MGATTVNVGGRLVDREPDRHPLSQLPDVRQAVHRLLHQLEAIGGKRLDRGHRLLHVPRSVGVHAQRHARSGGGPHRGHASGVALDPHLELDAIEPLAHGRRRLLGGRGAVERGDRRVDRNLARRAVVEQRGHGHSAQAPRAIPQGEVDRRQRGGQRIGVAACLDHLRVRQLAAARQHAAIALERARDPLQADAVISRQGRRLPVPACARIVGDRDRQQLALADRPV